MLLLALALSLPQCARPRAAAPFSALHNFNDPAQLVRLQHVHAAGNDKAGRFPNDKNLFWWLFKAREDAENKPTVLVLGGGPGTSGVLSRFLAKDVNGTTVVKAAPYSWTDDVNLLAIHHPVGVGFSHGAYDSLRRTSEEAAWDIDDFLQVFWENNPELAKNPFLVHSGSYGGTYIPNLINVIRSRSSADVASTRLKNIPDVMMSNVWSDPLTHFRHYVLSMCHDLGFYNSTTCEDVIADQPACLDAIQRAVETRMSALEACHMQMMHSEALVGRDLHDNRCPTDSCFRDALYRPHDVLNSTSTKQALGVPEGYNYNISSGRDVVHELFISVADLYQPAYKLLAPAIEDGLRVLVYNGANDGICPRRGSLAWMNLLETKYQAEFRAAPEVAWPGVGWFKQAGALNGTRAGNYTFVAVYESGHGPFMDQPKVTREILRKWLKNEPFLG